jgi:signal transduction histidine kinase
MKIILRNLVENALKYTDGKVWVRIKDGCVEVADEGEGIPEDAREKIFEKFYRLDLSRDRRKKGYGIGLSLVKELAERMGMKVELDSEIGRGSAFKVIWGDGCEGLRKEDPKGDS